MVILGYCSVYVAVILLNPDFSACQCNGHSKCTEGNRCGKCKDNTDGESRMVFVLRKLSYTRCQLVKSS